MNKSVDFDQSFLGGVKACLPTILGYWSIGFAAGSIGALSGHSLQEIGLLAGLLYAGSAQFLFYGLDAAGATPLAIVFAVMLVNVRYLLMSSSLSPYFKGQSNFKKLVGGVLLTDETFAVASQHAKQLGSLPFRWFLGLNLTAYLNWIVANLAGAALAGTLPASIADGLSFSLTAMFLGLLLLTFFASSHRSRDLIAIIVASCLVLWGTKLVDTNTAILTATILGATAGLAFSRLKAKEGIKWILRS